jgi:hypothetical protein
MAIGGGVIAYYHLKFSHCCSYVGEQGIAIYRIRGSRSAKVNTQMLLFKEATNLYTSQTRNYYNGAYSGTTYSYNWILTNRQKFVLSGSHGAEKGVPGYMNEWHCANAGENAWNNTLLPAINDQLNRLGYVEFPIQGNPQAVRIGDGFMEFVTKNGSVTRCEGTDMKDITLGGGTFKFNHKDATWWSGKGKFSFTYSNIPNARLFLICLERLMGIRWN